MAEAEKEGVVAMTATNHPWSSDPVAQAAVRAAEDAAAAERTPPPDHRELPGAVAELRERVARLEGWLDSRRVASRTIAAPLNRPQVTVPEVTPGETLADRDRKWVAALVKAGVEVWE